MVFNTPFNNISVISWWSVLLMEETGLPGETTDLSQVTDKLYHMLLFRVHLAWAGFEVTTLVVIGTDCTGSCKSNYHTCVCLMIQCQRWLVCLYWWKCWRHQCVSFLLITKGLFTHSLFRTLFSVVTIIICLFYLS